MVSVRSVLVRLDSGAEGIRNNEEPARVWNFPPFMSRIFLKDKPSQREVLKVILRGRNLVL